MVPERLLARWAPAGDSHQTSSTAGFKDVAARSSASKCYVVVVGLSILQLSLYCLVKLCLHFPVLTFGWLTPWIMIPVCSLALPILCLKDLLVFSPGRQGSVRPSWQTFLVERCSPSTTSAWLGWIWPLRQDAPSLDPEFKSLLRWNPPMQFSNIQPPSPLIVILFTILIKI